MTARNPYLAQVFKKPPLIAFKRQKNLRENLIRAQIPRTQERYPKRKLKYMTKCGSNCTACPYIREGKNIKINGVNWYINKKVNCQSFNVVYAICCKKDNCKQVYIGETRRIFKFRLDNHRGYVNNSLDNATGFHFNQPGHSLADLSVTVLEQVRKSSNAYRKEREEYFIRKFNTVERGMNRKY